MPERTSANTSGACHGYDNKIARSSWDLILARNWTLAETQMDFAPYMITKINIGYGLPKLRSNVAGAALSARLEGQKC